jgi:hypothetical protein
MVGDDQQPRAGVWMSWHHLPNTGRFAGTPRTCLRQNPARYAASNPAALPSSSLAPPGMRAMIAPCWRAGWRARWRAATMLCIHPTDRTQQRRFRRLIQIDEQFSCRAADRYGLAGVMLQPGGARRIRRSAGQRKKCRSPHP